VDPEAQTQELSIEERIGNWLQAEPDADSPDTPTTKETQSTSAPATEQQEPDSGAAESTKDSEAAATKAASDTAKEGEGAAPETTEEEGVRSIEELAEAFEVTPEEFTSTIHVKGPDGTEVPLAEAISAFQAAPDAERISQATAAKTAELEAQGVKLSQEHDAKMGELQQLTARMISELDADAKINWDELEQEDPAEWNKQKIKQAERREMVRAAMDSMNAEKAKRDAENDRLMEEWQQAEMEKVREIMPTWRDEKVWNAKGGPSDQLAGFMEKMGYTAEDQRFLWDHRNLMTAWYASEYLKLKSAASVETKKLKKLPKLIPVGARVQAGSADEKRHQELRRNLRKSGKLEDAAAIFEEGL
jgi:hypothetical protein